MFGKTILKAGKSEIEALKKRYRLTRLSDQEALQAVWDRMSADPSFHTKNLDKNRTDLGQK